MPRSNYIVPDQSLPTNGSVNVGWVSDPPVPGTSGSPDTSRPTFVSGSRALREAATGRSADVALARYGAPQKTCPTPRSLATGGREFVGFMPHDSRARILLT